MQKYTAVNTEEYKDITIPIYNGSGEIISAVPKQTFFGKEEELKDFDSETVKNYLDERVFNQEHAKESLILALKNSYHKSLINNDDIPRQLVFCESYNSFRVGNFLSLLSKSSGFPLVNIRLSPDILRGPGDIASNIYVQSVNSVDVNTGNNFKDFVDFSVVHFQDFDKVFPSNKDSEHVKIVKESIQNDLIEFMSCDSIFAKEGLSARFMTSVISFSYNYYNNDNSVGFEINGNGSKKNVSESSFHFDSMYSKLVNNGVNPGLLDKGTFFTGLRAPSVSDLVNEIKLPGSYLNNKVNILASLYGIDLEVTDDSVKLIAKTIVDSGYKRNVFEIVDTLTRPYLLYPSKHNLSFKKDNIVYDEANNINLRNIVLTPSKVFNYLKRTY